VTYSGQTAILGAGTTSPEAVQAFIISRGPQGAVYVDLPYKPPPPELGRAIVEECQRYASTGHTVNWDMCAGQICHETAYYQSSYARDRYNPGGIGAINSNPDLAITFPSVEAGVRAHVAHLLVYAVGDGPWSVDDPRRDAVAAAGWLGVADVWGDLNGRWAYPGKTYGTEIAAKGNALVTFANDASWDTLPPIRVVFLPSGASNRPGFAMRPQYITIHETANTSAGATAEMHSRYLAGLAKAGKTEPSWHYTVDDHEIVQHLPIDENGWHAGDGSNGTGNRKSIGIELCVNKDGNFTKTQENAALLVAKLQRETPNLTIVQHNHWSGKDCPHVLRSTPNGWTSFMVLVTQAVGSTPAPDPNMLYVPETKQYIVNQMYGDVWVPMLDSWHAKGDLAVVGWPLLGMTQDEDGIYRQVFENLMLEYNPATKQARFGGLGQRYVALLKEQA
jgi:N-acetylmuramoyl-L-alanine amidase